MGDVIARRDKPVPLERAHATVPAIVAVTLGAFTTGTVLFGLALLDRLNKSAGMRLKTQLIAALFAGCAVAVIAYVAWWLYANRTDLLYEIEEITRRDLDGDGLVGAPQMTRQFVPIDQNRLRVLNLPASMEQLREFAGAVLDGEPTSYARWRGHFRDPVTGVDTFAQVRSALIGAGLVVNRGNQGLEWTPEGWGWAEGMMDDATPLPHRASARVGRVGGANQIPARAGEWEGEE